jgi:Ca2+-binding EF-hand superfamily protein
LLVFFQIPAALAGPQPRSTRLYEQWKKADVTADGALSRWEAASIPRLAAHFDAIDRNADGRISAEEVRAWRKALAAQRRKPPGRALERFVAKADRDGDGALDRAEIRAGLPRLSGKFDRIDRDRNGRLSRDELESWLALRRSARRH